MTPGLSTFSAPASVAVVGASADPGKWGHWVARGALRGAHERRVHLVNARGAHVAGAASVRSLTELPEVPELVVLCTPALTVPGIVDEALDLGVRGFVGITARLDRMPANGLSRGVGGGLGWGLGSGPGAGLGRGFGRGLGSGPGGSGESTGSSAVPARTLEDVVVQRIRAAGARLLGPNCLGLYDAATTLELAWGTFHPGELAIVSQSGQLGLELAGLAAHTGLGVSRFVSVGNQRDITAVEILADLVEHESTRAVVLYLESFEAGRPLLEVLAGLRAAGRHVIVLTVGSSTAGQAAARSHTGALTADAAVVAAACRAAGAVLVQTPAEAVDLAHLLIGRRLPAGPRIAVVSDSGGQGALAADGAERHGLAVPVLTSATQAALADVLPAGAGVANPIDLAGAGEEDLGIYSRIVATLLAAGEVDSVVLSGYFGCYGADAPALLERELEVVEELEATAATHDRPVVVHSMSHDSVAVRHLRSHGIPTLHTIDGAVRGVAQAATLAQQRPRPLTPAAPMASATDSLDGPRSHGRGPDGQGPENARSENAGPDDAGPDDGRRPEAPAEPLDYLAGRAIVEACGVPFPPASPLDLSPREAGEFAGSGSGELPPAPPASLAKALANLPGPYVLKAGWLEHKTEHGGVVVDLDGAEAVEEAWRRMAARLGPGGYVVESMDTRRDVVEVLVGTRRDASFGPLILVGLGGTAAEIFGDVAIDLAPVDPETALGMLQRLRGWPLLDGYRGRPRADVAALVDVIAGMSRLLEDHPDLREVEVNPVRVGPEGALAVDALVLRPADPPPAARHTDPRAAAHTDLNAEPKLTIYPQPATKETSR